MKLFFSLIALVVTTNTINAQTKTWVGPDGFWSEAEKWDPIGVPTLINDVIVPTGSTLAINTDSEANSISVNDGANVEITADLYFLDTSIFAEGSQVNLLSGRIVFGAETSLTVTGILNMTSGIDNGVYGWGMLEINSPGSLNINASGASITLGDVVQLNIGPAGVMNIDGDLDIEGLGMNGSITNEGVINKISGLGATQIMVPFDNVNGTINVTSGTLDFSNCRTVHTSTINVNESAELIWSGNSNPSLEGDLVGVLDGPLTMDNSIRVLEGTTASFNFTGLSQVNWMDINHGSPGTLLNYSTINLNGESTIDNSTLINHGILNLNAATSLIFSNEGAVLDNQEDGVINLNTEVNISSVSGPNNIINSGQVNSQAGAVFSTFSPNFTNLSSGVINIGAENLIWFYSTFSGTGEIRGEGTFAFVDQSSLLEGHLYPGDGAGSIDHGSSINLTTTEETVYHLDILGTTPESEYDVFNINDEVDLNGNFDINLGFPAELNDEFVVITFSDTVATNLPETAEAEYDGTTFIFDVVTTETELTLRVADVVGIDDLGSEFPNLSIGPNPSRGAVNINFGEYLDEATVEIFDLNARLVSSTTIQGQEKVSLELDEEAGVYMIFIEAKGKRATYRLLRE